MSDALTYITRTPDVRAVSADPVQGKPAWNAQYRIEGKWYTVRNSGSFPIAYVSPEYALDAAERMDGVL